MKAFVYLETADACELIRWDVGQLSYRRTVLNTSAITTTWHLYRATKTKRNLH